MKVLLAIQLALLVLGAILALTGYSRRDPNKPFVSWSYVPWIWSESYAQVFRDRLGHRLFAGGMTLVALGSLAGVIYWTPIAFFD